MAKRELKKNRAVYRLTLNTDSCPALSVETYHAMTNALHTMFGADSTVQYHYLVHPFLDNECLMAITTNSQLADSLLFPVHVQSMDGLNVMVKGTRLDENLVLNQLGSTLVLPSVILKMSVAANKNSVSYFDLKQGSVAKGTEKQLENNASGCGLVIKSENVAVAKPSYQQGAFNDKHLRVIKSSSGKEIPVYPVICQITDVIYSEGSPVKFLYSGLGGMSSYGMGGAVLGFRRVYVRKGLVG